ncbi:LolA family protein [Methylovirgula sp. 4M-Z18]|uniref:LolA family protein n=1 Tax=Methylovirgula sp. 4M-Z18 TaxID=2293567 RepID=UPI001AECDD73|nr:outer-membrane lipoprotein carrier protein LolA [Methylovirgula sp. 4M-Z18]
MSGAALAQQNAPLKLIPQKPAQQAKPPAAKPAPAAPVSANDIIDKANESLNSITTLTADFTQLGAGGDRLEGRLLLQRPGRLRFEYQPPSKQSIVADGTTLAMYDLKVKQQPDKLFISQTPLKFILADHVDLGRDFKVVKVESTAKNAAVTVEDTITGTGTYRIKLLFDPSTFALKQWIITDPQGYETVVSLFNVDQLTPIDAEEFRIEPKGLLDFWKKN